jgi:hypothetical protein
MNAGNQCDIAQYTIKCDEDQKCQCVKFRFQCSELDQGCTEQEQSAKTIKWSYSIVSRDSCKLMKENSSVYMDLTCCSKNSCNKPEGSDCSNNPTRRRNLRKL